MLSKNVELNNKMIIVTGAAGFIDTCLFKEISGTTIMSVSLWKEYL